MAAPAKTGEIIIHTPDAQVTAIEKASDPLLEQAGAVEVANLDQYHAASDILRDCKTMEKEITETLAESVAAANRAHKTLTGLRARLLEPVKQAQTLIKGKMAGYVDEQERIAQEEERRRQAEAQKADEDRRLAEAAELEASGHTEEAEAVLDAPVAPLPIVKPAPPPKAAGTASRKKYTAEVVDLRELARAVADGKVPASVIEPNRSVLNALAAGAKEAFDVPGCRLATERLIAARAR